jgi:hypothetical protein
MPLLHPALFWVCVPLAGIPILLHLLTLHRLRTVELSTFRFLFDSYVQQRRRMQFLEALLAMLRTLFILFLIVMICRPVVEQSSKLLPTGSSGGRDVLLMIDCSASMNARSRGKTALERAQAAALAVADRLGREDRLTLIRVTSGAEELVSRFSSDAQEVRERIEGLKPTSARGNIYAAFVELFGPDAPRRTNPLIYLFTDCQATGWQEARNQGLDKLVPAKTPLYLVNVAPTEEQPNVAVIGDAPRQSRAIAGLPFALQPRVVNYSKSQSAELTLGVFIDEKEVFRKPLTVQPGETVTPHLPPYVPREPGVQRGRFEISSQTPDRFPDDDLFRFSINVVPRVKVLLVNGNPAMEAAENEGHFLRVALTARDSRAGEDEKRRTLEAARDIQRSLDVQEVAEPALTAETLRDVSVAILANCGRLTGPQMEWLREHVFQGGGLLIFPGDRVAPDMYNQQFFVPGTQGEQLTAASLGPPEGDPENDSTFARIDDLNFSHPALSVFDNPDPKVKHFKTTQIYKRFKLTLPEKARNTWAIARLSTGSPALVESHYGNGRVILAAFPAHTRWTSLPAHGHDFVPFVLRLTSHLARAPEIETPSAILADGVANLSVARSWEPIEANVRPPSGHLIPQRLERSGSRLIGVFEHTSERGYYSFEVKSKRTDQPHAGSLAFAVNLAPEESNPAIITENHLRAIMPSADFHFVDAAAEAEPLKDALGGRQEVWRPLWFILLFAIIVLEFLMATTSGRGRQAEERLGEQTVE